MIFHESSASRQFTILMKYHALSFFSKSSTVLNCHLLQIIGGALRNNTCILNHPDSIGLNLVSESIRIENGKNLI